jgi:hypothetical protein
MNNPNLKKFYQNAPQPVNYLPNVLVDNPPQYAPLMSGLMLINPATKDIWVSAGNKLVSDWISIVGGGGGTSITLQTNGSDNGSQTLLNLRASGGSGIVLEDTGTGTVLISADNSNLKQFFDFQSILINAFDTTYKNVTNSSWVVGAGKTYKFRFTIPFLVEPVGVGLNWSLSSTDVTFGNLNFTVTNPTASNASGIIVTNGASYSHVVTNPSATSPTNANTVMALAIIEGTVEVTSSGTIYPVVQADGFAGSTLVRVAFGAKVCVEYFEVL